MLHELSRYTGDFNHGQFDNHQKPRRFGTLFFEVLLFTDTASVVNGKTSKKSMQKNAAFFWCVKTLMTIMLL